MRVFTAVPGESRSLRLAFAGYTKSAHCPGDNRLLRETAVRETAEVAGASAKLAAIGEGRRAVPIAMPELAGLIATTCVLGEYRVLRLATAPESVKALVPGDKPPGKSSVELAGLRTFTAIAGAKVVLSELVNAFSVFAA